MTAEIACCDRPAAGAHRVCPECNHEDLLVCPECEMCRACQADLDKPEDQWLRERGLEVVTPPSDDIDGNHPQVWYDSLWGGCWWGQGHLTLDQVAAGAKEYDSYFEPEDLDGCEVLHLWRSRCGSDGFKTRFERKYEFQHPVTRVAVRKN